MVRLLGKANLMAHAGGFEDYVIKLFGDEPEDLLPLGEILSDQLPARVRPAGDISSYSNHGTGVAAHIVQRVSGTDWADYVEEEIFQPLGMEYATFRQPLPTTSRIEHSGSLESTEQTGILTAP